MGKEREDLREFPRSSTVFHIRLLVKFYNCKKGYKCQIHAEKRDSYKVRFCSLGRWELIHSDHWCSLTSMSKQWQDVFQTKGTLYTKVEKKD